MVLGVWFYIYLTTLTGMATPNEQTPKLLTKVSPQKPVRAGLEGGAQGELLLALLKPFVKPISSQQRNLGAHEAGQFVHLFHAVA